MKPAPPRRRKREPTKKELAARRLTFRPPEAGSAATRYRPDTLGSFLFEEEVLSGRDAAILFAVAVLLFALVVR